MITVTSVEAQNRFGQLLDTVQREPVTITRHGRVAAVLMTPQAAEAQRQGVGADAARQAGLAAITNFRGAGRGGSVAQLLEDRQANRQAEARKEEQSKTRRKASSK